VIYGNKSEVGEICTVFTQLRAGRRVNESILRVHVRISRSASYVHQINPQITWFLNIDCEWNKTRKPLTKAAGAASRLPQQKLLSRPEASQIECLNSCGMACL
jgi:hypothetical protein